jgi:RNA polymerase sigma factor (sigma-70 family)
VDRARVIEDLHRRYAGVIYDKCVRMLGSSAEAKDAVQDTFLAAFRAYGRYEERGKGPLPWLYRIATNTCLQVIRRRRVAGQAQELAAHPELPAPAGDPASALAARRLLEELVLELDERDMSIVVGHFLDGLDQGALAEQLGISRRAVVKRLTKLRGRARGLWDEDRG